MHHLHVQDIIECSGIRRCHTFRDGIYRGVSRGGRLLLPILLLILLLIPLLMLLLQTQM